MTTTNFNQNNTQPPNYPTSNFVQENMGNQQNTPPPMPDNYLVLAIVATVLGLCSCIGLIAGIIGIVFASQVKSKYNMGDYEGAVKSAKNAKIASIVGLALDILGIVANIVYYVLVVDGDLFNQLGAA